MKKMLMARSIIALLITIIPSLLFLSSTMVLDQVKWIMLIATIAWFAITPFWMEKGKKQI